MTLADHTPAPPLWHVDTEALWAEHAWLGALDGCPQDAVYHAEGDVGTHVRMVLEALAAQTSWRELPEHERQIVFWAAVFHDVAKPACTRHEFGRVSSRGHSPRGAIFGRATLWQSGVEFALREAVCGLVRHHQVPLHGIDRSDIRRVVHYVSQTARCDLLAVLAEADIRGRITAGQQQILESVGLFRQYTIDENCFDSPRAFPSDHSRFLYFAREGRDRDYLAWDDTLFTVTVMSGLPGAGKDTWTAANRPGVPVVSPDDIRRRDAVSPTGNQGAVIAAARREARALLRSRTPFVWNATNLSREIRGQVIDLCAAYHAWVEVVYVETTYDCWLKRNQERDRQVPAAALERMLERWEVPDLSEAHQVCYVTE